MKTWRFIDNMPITQLYRVGIDNEKPAFTATQSPSDIFTWSFANSSTGAVEIKLSVPKEALVIPCNEGLETAASVIWLSPFH
jgi:hypothetical protein